DPVRFVQADIELWAADAPKDAYDLIVSNACFQWLDHPGQTLGHIQRLLRPGGLLTFATFGPDTFNELHASFHEAYTASGHAPQRHGLSFQSADGWVNHLNEAGFDNIRCEGFIQREIYASPREFLHSVKAMGASTSQADTTRSIGTRRLFADMYKSYEDKFSVQGGIAATYDVLIIQAEASR
ncbi:methyltransferase domain-containing protein, partial [Paenibacillus sepulcri]|nr:methyltransferase domain-containing protein [Paenibacillus sepulcri]